MEANNMKAMREVLKECEQWFLADPENIHWAVMYEKCRAALAEPPRNCDRDLSDTQSIFAEFRQWVHASSLGCVSEPSASDAFRWLLAPSTERKGDDDGGK